jgi:hypothetical protein
MTGANSAINRRKACHARTATETTKNQSGTNMRKQRLTHEFDAGKKLDAKTQLGKWNR